MKPQKYELKIRLKKQENPSESPKPRLISQDHPMFIFNQLI
jgi:hypothetical protein